MENKIVKIPIEEAKKYKSLMSHEISAIYFLVKYSRKYREQHNNIDYIEISKELYEEWKTKIK
jgi:hypothetical protein